MFSYQQHDGLNNESILIYLNSSTHVFLNKISSSRYVNKKNKHVKNFMFLCG